MPTNKLSVLITRPEREGRVLADKLNTMGIYTHCQPMFDYQVNETPLRNNQRNNQQSLHQLLNTTQQPILIFISVAAVTYANTLYRLDLWQASKVFAVGSSTSKALKALNIDAISPSLQTSEGLLALPQLQNVEGENIIIVRGDGGREYLADTLKVRNATVTYVESYQRIWRQLASNIEQLWLNENINCIVITSDALLQSVVQLINLSDVYWQETCHWVVASERIAIQAKALGLKRVIQANGANDIAIAKAISSGITINMG